VRVTAILVALLFLPVSMAAAASKPATCAMPSAAGERTVALSDQGQQRPFLLLVPKGYDGRRALPLVLDLHGSGGNGKQQLDLSRLARVADSGGFAVAAPDGAVRQGPASFAWNVPGVPLILGGVPPPAGTPSDERYLLAVIAKVATTVCTDRRRVSITGMSGGARMASAMACDFPTRIAAVAPVAGLRAGVPVKRSDGTWTPRTSTCKPKGAVPILTFHGTGDMTNPFEGNEEARWGYSIPAALARWAAIDGCKGKATTTPVNAIVDLVAYTCPGRASVGLYRQKGGAHSWPDGTSGSVDASKLIWRFFKRRTAPPR
jgi:polyhydroxybutyrate depolymerase